MFGHVKVHCKRETKCIICENKAHGECDQTWESDHFPIEISVDVEFVPYMKVINRITNKNTDWKCYVEKVEEELQILTEEKFSRGDCEI
ncbi:hypothetical protein X777_09800 [Ooceraea biroi]|uniref:Uncharacterized protein n=1 Tax=Ooceraea biroi TaxID=2015173 RepID=A0A026W621_OOCBI|nr:hypothetical protein X777_09800 [Ooceraea biroi]